MNEDDLFSSLGGSLMKDLLADLQADEGDGWLSLAQLEKELAHLDAPAATNQLRQILVPPPPMSAASLVVSHAQDRAAQHEKMGGLLRPPVTTTAPVGPPPGMENAWQKSLQQFTAMSLDQDFLAADSVRKQQKLQPAPPPAAVAKPQLPPGFLEEARDYDVAEKVTLPPPPGLGSRPPGLPPPPSGPAMAKSAQQQQPIEELPLPPTPLDSIAPPTPRNSIAAPPQFDKPVPKTPRNSVAAGGPSAQHITELAVAVEDLSAEIEDAIGVAGLAGSVPKPMPITPFNSMALLPEEKPVVAAATPPIVVAAAQPQRQAEPMPPPSMPMPPHHPAAVMQPPPPQGLPQKMPQMVPPPQPVVAVQVTGGPAWQAPPKPAMPPNVPPMRVFCNPHPAAPPIPAQLLESRLMKARDIAYVVHSMMKPVLALGISEHDYDIRLLKRGGMGPATQRTYNNTPTSSDNKAPAKDEALMKEMESREQKSKQWSSDKTTLGYVAKSNVARPRALIASPLQIKDGQSQQEEQKQRATLWKSRIYCDQAYQSYLAVVEIWASATPGRVAPEVQPHLVKLMKCLGISPPTSDKASYENNPIDASSSGVDDLVVDSDVLKLFLKLPKGRTLLSRTLEQALLPPRIVQGLLPFVLEVLFSMPKTKGNESIGDPTDDRLFHALTTVIRTLPNISEDSVLNSAKQVQSHSKEALSSHGRMGCVHAVLERGNAIVASRNSSPSFQSAWKDTEMSFMSILQAMA